MDKDDGATPIVRILTSVRSWRTESKVLGLSAGFPPSRWEMQMCSVVVLKGGNQEPDGQWLCHLPAVSPGKNYLAVSALVSSSF